MRVFTQCFAIAKTEAKLLSRSMTIKMFWLMSLLSLMLIVFFPQYCMTQYDFFLPGMLAANCLFLLSIIKIILSPFISPVFIHEDNKNDSYQSLSSRPFYNLNYLFGKMFGFTGVMVVTDYIFMLALYIYYLLSYDYSFIFWPYLFYPIIITLPLSIFLFGINAFAARIRYLLVYLTPILLVLVFLPLQDVESRRFLDLGALTIPLAYSAVTGFYSVKLLVIQRLIFVFAGVGFVISASLIMENVRRSLHQKKAVIFGFLVVACFIASSGFVILDQKPVRDGITLRDTLRQHQNTISGNPQIHIDACHLDITHNKREIDVVAELSVSNPNTTTLSRFYLNLNPGFEVTGINPVQLVSDYARELNSIEITLDSPLNPNEQIEIEIAYSGSVDQDATYLHVPESFRERNHRIGLTVVGKQVAFIEPNYVMLPAEVNWYPTAVPSYKVSEPGYLQRDLAVYSLNVSTREGLTSISQGKMTESNAGLFSFAPEIALTQVSLTIGEYTKRSVMADSVEYSYHWLEKGFVGNAEVTEKDVVAAITSNKQRVENSFQLTYPFKRFQIVQTPVHYFGYNSGFELSGAYDQPEISIITESPFNLDRLMNPTVTLSRSGDVTQGIDVVSQMTNRLVMDFCRTNSNSLQIERKINPTSYIFRNVGLKEFSTDPFADYGSIFPQYAVFSKEKMSREDVLTLMAVNWLRGKIQYDKGLVFSPSKTDEGSLDRAEHKFISTKSLNDIVTDEKYYYELLDIINVASTSLFTFISMKTDTETTDIENAIFEGLQTPKNDFADALSDICETDVVDILSDYSDYITKAHYNVSDVKVSKHFFNDREYYNVRYMISNPTPYPGLVRCGISAPPDVMVNGAEGYRDMKIVNIEPFTQKEIGLSLPKEITSVYYTWFPFGPKEQKSIRYSSSVSSSDRIEYFDDIRIVESGTVPFEVVMDNLDEGCRIINPGEKSFLVSLFEKRARQNTFKKFTKFYGLENAPEIWTLTKSASEQFNMNEFYGKFSSCYYTKAGDGNSAIEYAVEIPEPGNYQLFISYPDRKQLQRYLLPLLESGDLGETTVRVFAEDGIHEDVTDIRNTDGDWALVGTYAFADSTAVIHITDKTNAEIVIADAIKLRKVK